MVVEAVISLVATAASIATSAAMAKKAADVKSNLKSTSPGEQSMLSLQKMKAADLAGQGGLSAGQYSRALMDNEASAVQAEGIVNKMSENPFADAYKNQAFAKFTISQLISAKEKAKLSLMDKDAEAVARNAINASNVAGQAANIEGKILARENEIKQIELQKKTQLFENVGRIVASGAKAVGTTVAYGQEAGWFDKKPAMEAAPLPASVSAKVNDLPGNSGAYPDTNAIYNNMYEIANPTGVGPSVKGIDSGYDAYADRFGNPKTPFSFQSDTNPFSNEVDYDFRYD